VSEKMPAREKVSMFLVLEDVEAEVYRQWEELWGEQNHPDGTGSPLFRLKAQETKDYNRDCVEGTAYQPLNWTGILQEEVYEALSETDLTNLYDELTQVAAVAVSWQMAIKRRWQRGTD
jgi:hypothetical protein